MIDTAMVAFPAVPLALYALRDAVRALFRSRRLPCSGRPRHLAEHAR